MNRSIPTDATTRPLFSRLAMAALLALLPQVVSFMLAWIALLVDYPPTWLVLSPLIRVIFIAPALWLFCGACGLGAFRARSSFRGNQLVAISCAIVLGLEVAALVVGVLLPSTPGAPFD